MSSRPCSGADCVREALPNEAVGSDFDQLEVSALENLVLEVTKCVKTQARCRNHSVRRLLRSRTGLVGRSRLARCALRTRIVVCLSIWATSWLLCLVLFLHSSAVCTQRVLRIPAAQPGAAAVILQHNVFAQDVLDLFVQSTDIAYLVLAELVADAVAAPGNSSRGAALGAARGT